MISQKQNNPTWQQPRIEAGAGAKELLTKIINLMKVIPIQGVHDFEKQNLTTQMDRHGCYDIYKCTRCGISGKSRRLGIIELKDNVSDEKLSQCSYLQPKFIRVIKCGAVGKAFLNLTPGSIHEILPTPTAHVNSKLKGVWVYGNGEAVKLLVGEYEYVEKAE